jgi:hypothetical protein
VTYQSPQLRIARPPRRYRTALYAPVERVTIVREQRTPYYPAWYYCFRQWLRLLFHNIDVILGLRMIPESMRREKIRRGIEEAAQRRYARTWYAKRYGTERPRHIKVLWKWDIWILSVTGQMTASGRERKKYTVENVKQTRLEHAYYLTLLVLSSPRLWKHRNRMKQKRSPLPLIRQTFPWTAYRVYKFIFSVYVLPVRVRQYFCGPLVLRDVGHAFNPPPLRKLRAATIAFAPTYSPKQDFATGAESTLSAAIDNAVTTIPITSRTKFPQDTTKQFDIVVMDADATTTTQPKMNPPTNVEFLTITAGHGSGAGNFTATGRGTFTNFPAVAHASGSYVAAVLTAEGLRNAKLNATGFFNAKDQYGARGDNGTDDAAALQATITAVPTIGWRNGNIRAGLVLLEPGSYVSRTALTLPTSNVINGLYESHVTIQGSGWKASQIRRQNADTNILMDASGSITAGNVVTRQLGFQFRDAGLNGADATTPLLRYYYHQTSTVERAYFQSNNGPGIEGVEYQDSHLIGSWFDYCGGATDSTTAGTAAGKEALRILSRADSAVTGTFGYSTDNSNAIWIFGNHFTGLNSDVRGQFVVSDNGSANQAHRCTFINNKIEQQQMGGDQVKLFNVHDIHFQNQEYTGYSLFTGRTAISWINGNAATSISVRASYFADEGNAGVTHAAVKVTSCNYWTLEDVVFNFSTVGAEANPAVFADFTGGTNDNFFLSNYKLVGTRTTPFFSGTSPVNFYTPLRSYVLAKSADQLLAGTAAQSVTTLVAPVGANSTWTFRCTLFVSNTASDVGGFKVAVSIPTGATMKVLVDGPTSAISTVVRQLLTASATLSTAMGTTATTNFFCTLEGTVIVAGTAGNIQIQAAEGTATDDITIQSHSNLMAYKV